MVQRAFISGDSPNLSIENIFIGRVVLAGPDTKKFIITSSKDNIKAIMAPAAMPGNIFGSTIVKNTFSLLAPKSIAASSMEESNPEILALTIINTKGILKVAWENTSVPIPNDILSCVKYTRSAIPIIISGIIMVIFKSASTILFPLNLYL